jgi:hypothetical protein
MILSKYQFAQLKARNGLREFHFNMGFANDHCTKFSIIFEFTKPSCFVHLSVIEIAQCSHAFVKNDSYNKRQVR